MEIDQMRVRYLKDHRGFGKRQGDVELVSSGIGKTLILNRLAEEVIEAKAIEVPPANKSMADRPNKRRKGVTA